MKLNNKKRHLNETTDCPICLHELENIEHFLLYCPALKYERNESIYLQKPFLEDENIIIGNFLFKGDNRKSLYKLWKKREKEIKIIESIYKENE